MTGNRTLRRSLAAILIMFGLAGCLATPATTPTPAQTPADPLAKVADTLSKISETPPAKQPTAGERLLDEYRRITRNPPVSETWRCCDYVRGCGRTPAVITLTVKDPEPLSDLLQRMKKHKEVTGQDLEPEESDRRVQKWMKADHHIKDVKDIHDAIFFAQTALFRTALTGDKGTVRLTGTDSQKTSFKIAGLDRRWDWGAGEVKDDPKTFRYSFVIEADGTGRYFDFAFADEGGRVSSRQLYQCEKR